MDGSSCAVTNTVGDKGQAGAIDAAIPHTGHCSTLRRTSGGDEFYGESFEHQCLGDRLKLKMKDGSTAEKPTKLPLPNGLKLTYGEVNSLAGDYFATAYPISDGRSPASRVDLFQKAWATLAEDSDANEMAHKILEVIKKEANAVATAVKEGKEPSFGYSGLDTTRDILSAMKKRPKDVPGYLDLSLNDLDHFGADAHLAYEAGHEAAIAYAQKTESDLGRAYAMNAFADHFLADSFSSGHMRTPRRLLRSPKPHFYAQLCAKFMHDEDCAIGLHVVNPRNDPKDGWTAYGDKYFLDKINKTNQDLCVQAMQTSADEVYYAWKTKSSPEKHRALEYAPTLESASGQQKLPPLFKANQDGVMWRRAAIENRKDWKFTPDFEYADTASMCASSGRWDYPISIDR